MDPAVLALFSRSATLADALRTGLALSPPWNVVEVINQDEFTLDIILQATPTGPAVVLDCT